MHELTLLIDIAMALVLAFIGGLIARRIGLPTIVGYLLAGIVIGPFTPGFVGNTETIAQLAELGVIFLMFGVGLHFSLRDLWRVRHIAIPGAVGQMTLTALLGFALSQVWGWTPAAGLVLGLALSVASTVVLLRGLMDNGLLNTPHGQAAVGWLVFEDLATVLILLLMPALSGSSGEFAWQDLAVTLLKAGVFVVFALFVGARVVPCCCFASPTLDHGSSLFWRFWPSRSARRSVRPTCSGSPWRSAPSSPELSSVGRRSATR